MARGVRGRLAAWERRVRRLVAVSRRRDPKPWVAALIGMVLGMLLFVAMVLWTGVLHILAGIARALR